MALGVAALLCAPVAWGQAGPPQPAPGAPVEMQAVPPAQPAPPRADQPKPGTYRPGFIDAMGRWFSDGASAFTDHLRGAKRRMDEVNDQAATNRREMSDQAAKMSQGAAEVGKNAADATRDAVDAVSKLGVSRMMSGREKCAQAPNGAPDCVVAAEALCRKHGYKTGKSMDFTSAEECPVRTILGEAPKDQCSTVTFISRAMCQ